MEKEEISKDKPIKSDKRQTEFLIGAALIIIGAIILYTAIMQPKVNGNSSNTSAATVSASSVSELTEHTVEAADIERVQPDERILINLNSCSAEDLMQLKGIGESKANAIIAYRNVLGAYTSTDEIKNISGISDKLYESIKDNLTV